MNKLISLILHGPWGPKKITRKQLLARVDHQSEIIKVLSQDVARLTRELRERDGERL